MCFNFLKLFLYFFLFKVEKYFQNYVLCLFYIFVLFFQFESIAFNLNNFIFILIFPESHVFKNNRSKSFFFFIYFYIFDKYKNRYYINRLLQNRYLEKNCLIIILQLW